MSVIVTQLGARHNYAIPRMLYRAGHLEALYTDSCANRGVARILDRAVPAQLRRGRVEQLLQRRVVGVPSDRIFVTDNPLWSNAARRTQRQGSRRDHLSEAAIRWGLRGATVVYSMFGEALDFLRLSKSLGARIAIDIFITPIAHRIVREERSHFPDWESQGDEDEVRLERHVDDVLRLADVLTCPGQNVVDGLRCYASFEERKARVIPYACGFDYRARRNVPTEGRVLFAGTAELRKGIHYLARAANLLVEQGRRYEFRVAGAVSPRVREHEEARHLTFLGHLPVPQLTEEFMNADLFVLPTLAEGSATVVYEALAAGLPVVTTPSAGSIVSSGDDGLIVPERDPVALANAIDEIVNDRARRERMALATRHNLARYTELEWQTRLVRGLGLGIPETDVQEITTTRSVGTVD